MQATEGLWTDFKRFQVIRILNIIHEDRERCLTRDNKKAAEKFILQRITAYPEFPIYIDLIIEIDSWFQLYRPSPIRIFPSPFELTWSPMIRGKGLTHPLYILFCSSPNEETDTLLRENLKIDLQDINARIEPISYYVYGNSFVKQTYSELVNKLLVFMFFQARDHDLVYNMTNAKQFLETPMKWSVVAMCGLPRGDFDGFILFACGSEREQTKLINDLKSASEGYYSKIAPILLYKGKLATDFSVKDKNLDILRLITE